MSATTIREKIRDFAGRVVLGQPVQQIERPEPHPEPVATIDAILDARQTAENFARRMIDLAEARGELDTATATARNAVNLDLAGMLAVDPSAELPDLDEIQGRATKAQTRVKALKTLADREVETAHVAVLTLRRAAARNIEAAVEAAKAAVRDAVPSGFFAPDALAKVFDLSQPARECTAAKHEIDRLCAYSVPLANAPLFGKCLPGPYRVEPLPTGKGHILPRDAFDPRNVAADIKTVLDTHIKSVGFFAGMSTEPASTSWTTTA